MAIFPWLIHPRPDDWICWKESQVNSEARRAWTQDAANFLAGDYQPGQGILTSFGDLTGIFREAGIPLRDTLHQGNVLEWLAATARPDLFLRQRWAVAIAGDEVATAVEQATRNSGPRYHLVQSIQVRKRSGDRNLQAGRHMTIPFTKAHGAGNDFLLTWSEVSPAGTICQKWRAPYAIATPAWAPMVGCFCASHAFVCLTLTAARLRCRATARAVPPRS